MNTAQRPQFAGETTKENPKQFLRDLDQYIIERQITDGEAKCSTLCNALKVDSQADNWFESLDAAKRTADWKWLQQQFRARWITVQVSTMSDADALEYLIAHRLIATSEIMDYVRIPDQPVRRRYRMWAGELASDVARQHIHDRVAELFRRKLPAPLRRLLNTTTSWKNLIEEIEKLDEEKLNATVEDEKRLLLLEERSANRTRTGQSDLQRSGAVAQGSDVSTMELAEQLSQMSLGKPRPGPPPLPPPHHYTYPYPPYAQGAQRPWTAQGARAMAPSSSGARAQPPTAVPMTNRRNNAPQQQLEELRRNALPIQPNTQEGRTAYEEQVRQWHERNGPYARPNETRPYPLSPGTKPAASGECYRCGQAFHGIGSACGRPEVPRSEANFRALAGSILKAAERATPVHYVGAPSYDAAYTPYGVYSSNYPPYHVYQHGPPPWDPYAPSYHASYAENAEGKE